MSYFILQIEDEPEYIGEEQLEIQDDRDDASWDDYLRSENEDFS